MTDNAPRIHPTAVIDPAARLADDVQVGAFTLIGPDVEIGAGTVVGPHCSIHGPTRIGRDNRFVGHAAIGGEPQDKKFAGERVELRIGDRNTIREFVTINRGTGTGGRERARVSAAGTGARPAGGDLPGRADIVVVGAGITGAAVKPSEPTQAVKPARLRASTATACRVRFMAARAPAPRTPRPLPGS